ncbi:hypothetical protein [Nonomuraea soli]|uniref:Uncharacterized protein n=3 Tax=Nonomuraea soli TaxID=1032476 RepID=A0A7W0HSX2_9ACTN|nr:hypothetical protein [Nonomuraea soli]MBA2894445.1 hypothetical protein [Nonomuraea soli]
MKSADVRGRAVATVAVLIMNLGLLLAAGFAIGWARNRGVLCDGATVLCSGGDATPGQWQAEMTFRSTVAYGSYAVMALILIVSAVIAWRRRRNGIVITQLTALAAVAALAVLWEPYVSLH